MAIGVGPPILPAEESAENPANKGSHEPVSEFIIPHDVHGFVFTEETVRCLEVPGADDHLFIWGRLDIAKPVGIPAKPAHHYCFRTVFSVLDHFQDGLMAFAGTPASVREKQKAFSEQRAQAPTKEMNRRLEQIAQYAFVVECAHADREILFDSQLSNV